MSKTAEQQEFYNKFKKYNDLTKLTTKDQLAEAKKELEPYLQKPQAVENCSDGTGIYYFVDSNLGTADEIKKAIGTSHIGSAGSNKFVLDRDGWMKSLECYLKVVDLKIKKLGGKIPAPTKSKIKLSGCDCEYKDKEFEIIVDLAGKNYDENKDLATCPQCKNLDKYKKFQSILNFSGKEVGNETNILTISVIHGAKDQPSDNSNDLQEKAKRIGLATFYSELKDWEVKAKINIEEYIKNFKEGEDSVSWNINRNGKVCKKCVPGEPPADYLQAFPEKYHLKSTNSFGDEITYNHVCGSNPSENNQEETKKYGEDYQQLKPQQQEDRKLVVNNWDKAKKKPSYWRSKHCKYCDLGFKWDKNSEYLDAEKKCQQELDNHKTSCPLKDDKKAQERKKQEEWDKDRKSTTRRFFTCEKCKGKIAYDKNIKDYKAARQQALSDHSHHEKKECGKKAKKDWIIAVYYSPNQGGNQHAPLDNSLNEDNFVLEKDNEGEIYQEQGGNKDKPGSYLPWIIGGIGIVLVIGIIYLVVRKNKENK